MSFPKAARNKARRVASCADCAPGKYTNVAGRTACDSCPAGSFCPEGVSTGLPCPSGRHQNGTMMALNLSMTSAADCLPVPASWQNCGKEGENQEMETMEDGTKVAEGEEVSGEEKGGQGEGGSQRKAKAGLPGHPGPLAQELVERESR